MTLLESQKFLQWIVGLKMETRRSSIALAAQPAATIQQRCALSKRIMTAEALVPLPVILKMNKYLT
jgi:hypothetical protein